ncbi:MAG: ABC transporter permease [Acidobacteriota bacterium]|nr:ABC transporter permease [Acidobacteriota bacterium]
MRDDLKAAFRSLRSSKGFTIAALIVLTLGIGSTTAIFSVVDAVVLRGLPFNEHDRLVAVGERSRPSAAFAHLDRDPDALSGVAPQNYLDWAAQQRVFESMAAIASGWLTLRQHGAEPESLVPQRVTADFFSVLRVHPIIGRAFTAENEVAGRDRVAILSDGLWRRRFGADPQIIGRLIPLEDLEGGQAAAESGGYEVVGVMPPDFAYPVAAARRADIWIPYVVPVNQRIRDPEMRVNYLQVVARLKPGVSLAQAQAQMDQIAGALEHANPAWNKDNRVGVRPLADHIVGARIRSWMLMLLGAVGVVLLISCANIANLLLARASAREREAAVRAALGASRWRLVRQLMTESLVLSVAGTACAIVVAWWAVQVLRSSMPEGVPRVTAIALDLRVLAAAAGLSLLTGILFGIFPALQLSKPDLSNALKDGARGSAGIARRRVRSALVVADVALAVVLLVGAALFIGSFVSLIRIDPGFSPDHVLIAQISPRIESRADPRDAGPAFAQIVERLAGVPGVVYASTSDGLPLRGGISATTITIPGTAIDLNAGEIISIRRVTPDFHRVLKIPLRNGRLFNSTDRADAPPVAVINESAATKYFPGQNPIGRIIMVHGNRTIVGVVGDVHQSSLESAPLTEAYVPMAQARVPGAELVIRTNGNPYELLPAVKAAVYAVLPDVPLRNVTTMETLIAGQVAQRKLTMLLLGLFGVLGLVIAAVGVYGVMAYFVSQRTREIGVRMALGATRSNVVGMVLLNACALVASGLIIGGVAAWYLSAASQVFLFRLEPTDPRAFAAAVVSLSLAALVASAIPARRAASVDPMVALRAE